MSLKLFCSSVIKTILGIFLSGLLIFLPAGTFNYANGWLCMAVMFIPVLFIGAIMLFKSPELLNKRINMVETQKEQKIIVLVITIVFALGFVVAGFDYRFKLSNIPKLITIAAAVVFVLSYFIYAEIMRENKYLSRTIEAQSEHKVVSKGLYSIVRHPMYATTIFMFLSVPLILNSLYSFAIFILYMPAIVYRIKYEEKFLEKELAGYTEYKQKVRYRLIPFIW